MIGFTLTTLMLVVIATWTEAAAIADGADDTVARTTEVYLFVKKLHKLFSIVQFSFMYRLGLV